jgi:CheY-like chemotaxis protein
MSSKQVLIIEDNEDIRESIQMVIEFQGYEVLTAANGQEALDLLATKTCLPSLILLDLMMPVMDGWTFANIISKDQSLSTIPLVIVSAFTGKTDIPKNACDTLEKPMNFDTLLKILKTYCG